MTAPGHRSPELAYDVVIPTTGRPSLAALLPALAAGYGPLPGRVLLVDDRRERSQPLVAPCPNQMPIT